MGKKVKSNHDQMIKRSNYIKWLEVYNDKMIKQSNYI
jgi:hypothetical protein